MTGEEQGSYLCSATNVAGTTFATVTLTITGSQPRVYIKPSDDVIERVEGEVLRLECVVAGQPTPSVTWLVATAANRGEAQPTVSDVIQLN